MRLAFVTTYDATNVRSWSGIPYYMARALAAQGVTIEFVGPLRRTGLWLLFTKKVLYTYLYRKRYLTDRESVVVKAYARQLARRLRHLNVDVVFSPSTIPIAYLEPKQPVAFWTDATFAGNVDFYPQFSNLCKESLQNGHAQEAAAMRISQAAIYSSEWAARTAMQFYGAAPSKVHVVPFGANIETAPPMDDVLRLIQMRARDTCKLLFLAVEWERKGGDIAVEVARELNARGIRTELVVVGCDPKIDPPLPDFVHARGFVNKGTEAGRAELNQLLAESHFLLLPTRADCTPVVLCEANAMGVPCVTTDVGGIGSVVRQHVNGMTFGLDAPPTAYASFIAEAFGDRSAYDELAAGAANEYHQRLNWSTSAQAVTQVLRQLVNA